MNFKLIVSVVLAGGVLIFLSIKPSNLLDQGGKVWDGFSRDFLAIFNGETKDLQANENTGNAGDVQAIYDAAPAAAGDETSAIAHDVARDRREAAKTAKVININAEELKQRVEDHKKQME